MNPGARKWLNTQSAVSEVLVPGTPTELVITCVLKHQQDRGLCAELLRGLLREVGMGGEDHRGLVTPTPPAPLTCPPSAPPGPLL